jgi:uncharacterized protein YdeI (YjbR/CyaY-like superfamily)
LSPKPFQPAHVIFARMRAIGAIGAIGAKRADAGRRRKVEVFLAMLMNGRTLYPQAGL